MPPSNDDTFRQAAALHAQGRLIEAARAYEGVVRAAPAHAAALCNLAIVYRLLARPADALAAADRALAVNPGLVQAHAARADALTMLKRFAEALDSYEGAVVRNPSSADAHANRANVLRELGRAEEAVAGCDRALALNPRFAGAHVFRGYALLDLQRAQDALASFDAALALNANHARALVGRGRALHELRRAAEAVQSFEAALAREPNLAQAHFHKAVSLSQLGRLEPALESAGRALALNADLVGAYLCRANVELDLGRPEEALADFKEFYERAPDADNALGHYVHAKTFLCDWNGLDALTKRLCAEIEAGERASYPFALLALTDDAALQRVCAERQAAAERPLALEWPARPVGDKIRIAYVSSDFYDHPVAHLLAGALAAHDRGAFEVFAISLGERNDEYTQRVRGAADHFIDMSAASPADIVQRARGAGIDIAVDLNGYTKGARTKVFASRLAPIQASYVGYLGTMGAPFMDYLIADEVLVPPAERAHYAEKLILLPWYQCNDEAANAPAAAPRRADHGLPEDAFVFCSFNSNFKLMPDLFETWMRILKRVPGGVLWLYAAHPAAERNLRAAAEQSGVDSDRLVFAERVSRAEHLARQQLADLMLDTFPYNGGATTSNALRAGVPVLTRAGHAFASRMGASLLHALGLSELIAETDAAYEETAVRLAADDEARAALRGRVAAAPMTALFSAEAFARNIERAYRLAMERHRAGLPPDDIKIS